MHNEKMIYEYLNEKIGTSYKNDEEIKWDSLNFKSNLTEEVLIYLIPYHKINYLALLKTRKFSENALRAFAENTNDVFYDIKLPFECTEEDKKYWIDNTFWTMVCMTQDLTENFIDDFIDKVEFETISCIGNLNERQIEKYYLSKNSFHPELVSNFIYRYPLSENFYRKYKDYIDWSAIGKNQVLSEEFIEEFGDRINWKLIYDRNNYSEDFKKKFEYDFFPLSEILNRHLGLYNYYKNDKLIDYQSLYLEGKIDKDFIKKIFRRIDWDDFIDSYHMKFNKNISEKFLIDFDFLFNWNFIIKRLRISEGLLEKHTSDESIDWNLISIHQKLSTNFIKKHADKLNWEFVCEYQELSDEILDTYAENIKWYGVTKNHKITEDFLKKYSRNIIWAVMSNRSDFTEDFADKFSEYLFWPRISSRTDYSEDFYRKHYDKLHWNTMSWKKLSFEFISDFKDYLNWEMISESGKNMTKEVMYEFGDRINWGCFQNFHNYEIPEQVAEKNDINWTKLCENQKLSEDFLRRNKDKVDWCAVYRKNYLSKEFIEEMKDYINARLIEADPEEKYYKRIR